MPAVKIATTSEVDLLIDWAVAQGEETVDGLMRGIGARIRRKGRRILSQSRLLTAKERQELGVALLRVMLSADLSARVRQWRRVLRFAESAYVVHAGDQIRIGRDEVGPERAAEIFAAVAPDSGTSPTVLARLYGREAFRLAKTMDRVITRMAYNAIKQAIDVGDPEYSLSKFRKKFAQEIFGEVTRKTKAYAEMVYRTNVNTAYQNAAYDEGASPEMAEYFPGWQYLGIKDGRESKDHRRKFDKFYGRDESFNQVRGPRVYNCRCSLRWLTKTEWAAKAR